MAIFQASEDMRSRGWSWQVQVSVMEVYNEAFYDLLDSTASKPALGQHSIIPDADYGQIVTGMTWVQVGQVGELMHVMERAARRRSVAMTAMNSSSSRSHMVVSLFLKGTHSAMGKTSHGALHLVDLAGSARLEKSGVAGDRLKETLNINKSLSSLATVFQARSQGQSHIPFRNSKLTHLLEPCLSGRGKTLMLVHVKANQSSMAETLCSLRFAKLVSQCDAQTKALRSRAQASPTTPATGNAKARSSSPPASRISPTRSRVAAASPVQSRVRTGRTRSPVPVGSSM